MLWYGSLGRNTLRLKEVVVNMEFGLLIFAGVLVVFEALAVRFGKPSTDGNDWINHRPA